MNINQIKKSLDLIPDKKDLLFMKNQSNNLKSLIKESANSLNIKLDVFLGGSFAKKTLLKSKDYDVDIFVRFYENKDISEGLSKILSKIKKFKFEKVHGSRDYFFVEIEKIKFEIIPVLRINSPKKAINVTDLSYFHVKYVSRKLNDALIKEVLLLKRFLKANSLYGAESYIGGISGYGVECLIIHYKKFGKFISEISKAKEKIVIDVEKHYKNKKEIFIELNESKLNSPIILIDPTWKERNVLAALNRESYEKLVNVCKGFVKKPSINHFVLEELNIENLNILAKKKKADFLEMESYTDKQEGDIAGTKLKKFFNFISEEIGKYFEIIQKEFRYSGEKYAQNIIIAKRKKEIIKTGPELKMEKQVIEFKKKNKHTFVKGGRIYSKIKIEDNLKDFIQNWAKKYSKTVKEMDITNLKIT